MAKSLNYTTMKKNYLPVTLPDKKVIMVGTPTKAIMADLFSIKDSIDQVTNSNDPEAISYLYLMTAKIMSRNKGGVKIESEYLEGLLDVEDLIIFFQAYLEFIEEINELKN